MIRNFNCSDFDKYLPSNLPFVHIICKKMTVDLRSKKNFPKIFLFCKITFGYKTYSAFLMYADAVFFERIYEQRFRVSTTSCQFIKICFAVRPI